MEQVDGSRSMKFFLQDVMNKVNVSSVKKPKSFTQIQHSRQKVKQFNHKPCVKNHKQAVLMKMYKQHSHDPELMALKK